MRINEQPMYYNYNRKNKWLGIMEYQSLLVIIGYAVLCGYITYYLPCSLEIKIYCFMILVIPIIAVACVHIREESILDMLCILIHFYCQQGIFVNKEEVKDLSKAIYRKIQNEEKFFASNFRISCCKKRKEMI